MPNQVLIIEPQNELKFKGTFTHGTSVPSYPKIYTMKLPKELESKQLAAARGFTRVVPILSSLIDFSGLFEQGHTTYMQLTNPSTDTVLFKIKTTAPKKYCVRPNSGALEPNSKVEIAITPQPVYVDPNEKHKHKFMVQSVVAPEGKTNIDQVWKEISPDQLMDYKLKCVFETPRGTNLNDSGDNAAQNEVTKKRVAVADEAKVSSTKDAVEGLLQNETKRKNDDHSSGATNAKVMFPKSENMESDLKRATLEVISLREEEHRLRQENLQLKEELLRLNQSAGGDGRAVRPHSYGPEKTAQVGSMPWVATALLMAFIGIIIGKFLM